MLNKKRLIVDYRNIEECVELSSLKKIDFFSCDLVSIMEHLENPFFFVFYEANSGDMIGRLTLHNDRIEFIRPVKDFEGKKTETFLAHFEDMIEEAEIVKMAKLKEKSKSYISCIYIRFGVYRVRDRLIY